MSLPIIRSYGKAAATGGSVIVSAASAYTAVSGPGASPVAGDTLVAMVAASDFGATGCGPSIGLITPSAGWSVIASGFSPDEAYGYGSFSRTASGTSADNLTLSGGDTNIDWVVIVACVFNISAHAYGGWATDFNTPSPIIATETVPAADLVIAFYGVSPGALVTSTISTPTGYGTLATGYSGTFTTATAFDEFTAAGGSINSTLAHAGSNLWAAWTYLSFTGASPVVSSGESLGITLPRRGRRFRT